MSDYRNVTLQLTKVFSFISDGRGTFDREQGIKNFNEFDGKNRIPYAGEGLTCVFAVASAVSFVNGERVDGFDEDCIGQLYHDIALAPTTDYGYKALEEVVNNCTSVEPNADGYKIGETGITIVTGCTVDAVIKKSIGRNGVVYWNVFKIMPLNTHKPFTPKPIVIGGKATSILEKLKSKMTSNAQPSKPVETPRISPPTPKPPVDTTSGYAPDDVQF